MEEKKRGRKKEEIRDPLIISCLSEEQAEDAIEHLRTKYRKAPFYIETEDEEPGVYLRLSVIGGQVIPISTDVLERAQRIAAEIIPGPEPEEQPEDLDI